MAEPAHRDVARSRWPYLSLLPIGFGAPVIVYAGIKASRWVWTVLGLLWCAVIVAGMILANTVDQHHGGDIGGGFLVVGWIGVVATAFIIRGPYERRMASPLRAAEQEGELRLRDRRRALELAQRNPALAREVGVGRPDLPGAADAGLVDVNNASVTALLKLPGMSGELATEIVEGREQLGGFSSLEDMGAALDLDGDLVERLRGAAVFLPRG